VESQAENDQTLKALLCQLTTKLIKNDFNIPGEYSYQLTYIAEMFGMVTSFTS
jgi:hypothetical protein